MQLKELFHRRYLFYGLSIVLGRGLELAVMFFAAKYLAKAVYGELEYYKKVLEVGGVFLSFGFPALIITYTRSRKSKVYLFMYAVFFVTALVLGLIPFLAWARSVQLAPGLWFYAVLFSGGILPAYLLIRYGSDKASLYKILFSLIYWGAVYFYLTHSARPQRAFLRVTAVLVLPGAAFIAYEWLRSHVRWNEFKRYAAHFHKLLKGSLALVLSNFANMMFLYTDIFIIRFLSSRPHLDIAHYSFSLNMANILMLIPFTLVQVDMNRFKENKTYYRILSKKILWLTLLGMLLLIPAYKILTGVWIVKYRDTFGLFLLILLAKFFQAQGVMYGTGILVLKRYEYNMKVNIGMIGLNVALNLLLFPFLGLYGVALASMISLLTRYLILRRYFLLRQTSDR